MENIDFTIKASDKLVGHAQGIFSYLRVPRTNAEQQLVKALMENGKITNDDIEAAAAQLLVRKWVKRIKNYDTIITKAEKQFEMAISELKDQEIPNTQKVDEDWIEYFYDLASRVSDDIMQELWARLLVSEQLNRGGIRKAMLNTIALMDYEHAEAFTSLCRLTFTLEIKDYVRHIPLVQFDDDIDAMTKDYHKNKKAFEKYKELCPGDEELDYLKEIGLITFNQQRRENLIFYRDDETAIYKCRGFSLECKGIYDDEDDVYYVSTGLVFFTQIGLSLYKTLIIEPYENLGIVLNRFVEFQSLDDQRSIYTP